jgi:hypothetical protein
MLKNTRLGLVIAVSVSVTLAFVGCGGVGAASINGVGSLARVAVSISPPAMTVTTGTTQPFTATVSNTSEMGVGWLVNGFPGGIDPTNGSSPFGTIDKNGNYTAPPFIPIPPNVTVTAVASADNSATANAAVSINGTPSPVSISPTSASLSVGGIALFTGTAGPGQAVNWLVENILNGDSVVGTIAPLPGSTNQVTYTAPLVVPGGAQSAQVHITVQSVANPLETASALVTVSAATGSAVVTIISPRSEPVLQPGQTQPIQASVTGVSDTTVSWEVDAIPGGNSNVGTIVGGAHDTAIYTAPKQLPPTTVVTVTAVSNADPSAHASIQVNLIPFQNVTVGISATDPCTNTDAIAATVSAGFTVTIGGLTNQNVTWQVNQITGGNTTVGTITPRGLYTAPANVPNPPTVTLEAVPVADPQVVGKLPVTITPVPVAKVTVLPNPASAQVGGGVTFTATVLGLGDADVAVTWNVNNENGGDPTIGTIEPGTSSGCEDTTQYVAPLSIPVPPTVYVTAVASDGATSPQVPVTILPPPPITELLEPGSSHASTVQVQTSDNQVQYADSQTKLVNGLPVPDSTDPVNWTLTSTGQDCSVSNGSICGTLTPMGLNTSQQFIATYTAPNTVPPNPQVTVTVTSAIDPSDSDFNLINITNAPPTIAINGPPTLQAGGTPVTYKAIITNANPSSIVWELGCISDSDSDNNNEDFCGPTTAYGPGCIKDARGGEICDETAVTLVPPNVIYTPPGKVSTAYYLPNACAPNGDPHASVVPINVEMEATGCPLQGQTPICTALACVTITP